MLPLFLYPLGFLGLLAVPALVAIYLFRNRFRRQVVSSLMLWIDPREAREGGIRLRRLQTPLLFLLELLIILLLVLAAADPYLHLRSSSRPLIVILDDSFSMLAGTDKDSPRRLAEQALAEQLGRAMPHSVRFLLAGDRVQVLGEPARTVTEALSQLAGWRCRSSSARLDEALALGAELGGDLSLLLVLTDQAPRGGELPNKGRLQWWAFGSPRGNVAFVNAARSEREGLDRCLLEIQNFSNVARSVNLLVEAKSQPLRRNLLSLQAGERQRLILQLPSETPEITARIDDNELALDNQVVLQPAGLPSVRVDVSLRDRRLRDPVEKALQASRQARLNAPAAQLLFTDRSEDPEAGSAWVVQFLAEKEATAYTGPFVLDRAHPLMEGVGLQSVIWGAGKGDQLEGAPVLMAGNIPLIAESEQGGVNNTRHILRIRLRPELSTLLESPDWPILMWNILSWRASALPGMNRPNIRLGEQAILNLSEYSESVRLILPDGTSRDMPIRSRQAIFRGEDVGRHEVTVGKTRYAFAVNALSGDESDLRSTTEGRWGDWLDDTTLRLEYQPISWALLLLLLVLALGHLLLMVRGRSDRTSGSGV